MFSVVSTERGSVEPQVASVFLISAPNGICFCAAEDEYGSTFHSGVIKIAYIVLASFKIPPEDRNEKVQGTMQLPNASTVKTLSASALLVFVGCKDGRFADPPARVHAVTTDDPIIASDLTEQVVATDGSEQTRGDDHPQEPSNVSPPYSNSFTMRKDDSGQFVVECGGIRFELTPTAPLSDGYFFSQSGRDLDFQTGGHRVDVTSQTLTVKRQKFGHVSRGDRVTVTKDRRTVRVNGQLRNALPVKFKGPGGVTFSLAGQYGNLDFTEDGERYFYDMLFRYCQIRQGIFLVDGESFGAIEDGDEVAISWDGGVTVNGKPRAIQYSGFETDVMEDSR